MLKGKKKVGVSVFGGLHFSKEFRNQSMQNAVLF